MEYWNLLIVLLLFSLVSFNAAPVALKPETSASFHTLTVCRGQMRSIACPNIQLLHIYNAFYGKLSGHDCQDPVTQLRDQIPTCFSRDAPRIIREACQGQQSCDLYAEDSLYNDPCPSVNKYLFVSFTCQGKSDLPEKLKMFEDEHKSSDLLPGKQYRVEGGTNRDITGQSSKRMSATVCSGQTGNIFCPSLKLLHIQSAIYGKQQGEDCTGKITRDTIPSCSAHDAVRTIKDMCDGQQSCDLFSEPELYGRSLCDAKTQKYLLVDYTCDGHSNLELQLKRTKAQSFVYQPRETPQNPFLRSTIPNPYNPWQQYLERRTLPAPNSNDIYKGMTNQQLLSLQDKRMKAAIALQRKSNEMRNMILKQQQANERSRLLYMQKIKSDTLAAQNSRNMYTSPLAKSQLQEPAQTRSFSPALQPAMKQPQAFYPGFQPAQIRSLYPATQSGQIRSPYLAMQQSQAVSSNPTQTAPVNPSLMIPLSTPLSTLQQMATQTEDIYQYNAPQKYEQPAAFQQTLLKNPLETSYQQLNSPIQSFASQQQQLPAAETTQSWLNPDAELFNKDTSSVRGYFNYRHSTCDQCNGDCRNYLCYGCGGCKEPPPEQQTYYYPYQRQDAAYHDAFAGNEMALSGLVIWPSLKLSYKKPIPSQKEKEEEKKLSRSKVEQDEDDDSDADSDDDDDEGKTTTTKSDVNKKSIKQKSL